MEIRHLKLIEAVAEEGSLTKAVDKLFVSQSALSHQLKDLEEELGTPVFHRVNKQLVLTSAGKIMLKSAALILNELERAEREVKKYILGQTGSLKICTECYTCYHWLPPIIKHFQAEYPHVELMIKTEYTRRPLAALRDGELDIAIIHKKDQDSSIVYHPLFRDELVAVVPAYHPWSTKKYVTAEHFEDETLFTHNQKDDYSTLFVKVLNPKNIAPKKTTYMQITEAIIEMVKAGMGVAVMAKWAVKPYLLTHKINLIPITKEGLYRYWYAALLKKNNESKTSRYFLDELIEKSARW